MKVEYIEKIYAGWLGKMAGIRLGAPVESWSFEQIRNVYGRQRGYLVDYQDFAADDDSNGPAFFLRALEHCADPHEMKASDVANALLNYAPYEHGFFWWGGYGISTEHTAYLNLRNGIPAPRSGSIAQNGTTVAEQIGGQIFIDCWGLVAPGNPRLAAKLAREAASVTHDGEGIWGGVFVAVCISLAFTCCDPRTLLKKALEYIPPECTYAQAVQAVMDYYSTNPDNWEECYAFIYDEWGYKRFPGNCHIIPNAAVMVLALLYGEGSFDETLHICNWCGWDTDCNAGNVGTIMGVLCGLDAIGAHWRAPINDLLLCSSAVGTLNILDVPYVAAYTASWAAKLAGSALEAPYDAALREGLWQAHFEYPGSTHAFRLKRSREQEGAPLEGRLCNTDADSFSGTRCLQASAVLQPAECVCLYQKTFYRPADLHDSRYDPEFTPLVYPGQTLHAAVKLGIGSHSCTARLYALDKRCGRVFRGEPVVLAEGAAWQQLEWIIPATEEALLEEIGLELTTTGDQMVAAPVTVLLDHFYADGTADYRIQFDREERLWWTVSHIDVSQMCRLKGLQYLEGGKLHLSCGDFGESYTGHHLWRNYAVEWEMTPLTGTHHSGLFRVQGGLYSYSAGFFGAGRAAMVKNGPCKVELASTPFNWEIGRAYLFRVEACESVLRFYVNTKLLLQCDDQAYSRGCVGIAVQNGSHCAVSSIKVEPLEKTKAGESREFAFSSM